MSVLRRRGRALLVTGVAALVVLAQTLIAAPAAFAAPALPKGAYWYTLLDLRAAWRITEGAGVTVAVIDSGVQATLPTLRGQVRRGLDLSGRNPGAQHDTAEPGGGDFGHGTAMAALIAGTGRGGGLTGVAPKATILPVDVENAGGQGSDTDIARGIRWAVGHGAKVINVSLGSTSSCGGDEQAAVAYAYAHDVIVVAAAGDSAGPVSTPASCPGALAIGGVDAGVHPWADTPSGPQIDFVAPAYNLVNQLLDGSLNGPLPVNSGTSQAAAIASATFALLRARFPALSARQIVTRALYNVHNGLGTGHQGDRAGDKLGYGMVLPRFALTEAAPAGAPNPIYDRFAREIGPSAGGSTGAPSSSTTPSSNTPSSTAPSSAPPSTTDSTAPASAPVSTGDLATGGVTTGAVDSSDDSSSPVRLIVIVAVLVVLVGGAVAFGLSRRHRPPPPPPGWPGR